MTCANLVKICWVEGGERKRKRREIVEHLNLVEACNLANLALAEGPARVKDQRELVRLIYSPETGAATARAARRGLTGRLAK